MICVVILLINRYCWSTSVQAIDFSKRMVDAKKILKNKWHLSWHLKNGRQILEGISQFHGDTLLALLISRNLLSWVEIIFFKRKKMFSVKFSSQCWFSILQGTKYWTINWVVAFLTHARMHTHTRLLSFQHELIYSEIGYLSTLPSYFFSVRLHQLGMWHFMLSYLTWETSEHILFLLLWLILLR